MRVFSSLALICILCALCLSATAQEAIPVRVGVAVLQSADKTVPVTEARDRLVKNLEQQKPEKKLGLSIEGVALDAVWGTKALMEAKGKNCQFVLSTQLTDLQTSYTPTSNGTGGLDYVPAFSATVEYLLARVGDGTVFAVGSAKGEDSGSLQGAVWQAMAHVAGSAIVDVAKDGAAPHAGPSAADKRAERAPSTQTEGMIIANSCDWLPTGIPHAEALRGVCEYAITLPQKMPNFICGQDIARYRGDSRAPADLISAVLRYEDGNESYSDVKVNGRPFSGGVEQNPGLHSTGEFGEDLGALFNPANHALFEYLRDGRVGEHAAWIFTYQIVAQKAPLWRMHDRDQVIAPPYSGELWIDQRDATVLRFRSVADHLPPRFPMKSVDLQIDYEKTVFGDGTDFVLPVGSALATVYKGEDISRNVVQFRDCHKFRARGRLVLKSDVGTQGPASSAQVPRSQASLQKELDESEAIVAAIGEQSLRDDEERQEAEQKQMLDAVTASTLQKLSELRREQQEIRTQQQAIAKNAGEVPDGGARTVLKVSARLVLVSVVLRDAKGHAVGGLDQENFRLFDEGKPQVITQFSVEQSAVDTLSQKNEEKSTAHAGGSVQAATKRSLPPAAGRDTAYLFDDVHASFGDLASARDAAGRHLGSLKAGERAAVFTTSGEVAVDFTDDRDRLLAGLRRLRPRSIIPESNCPPISYYMADLMVNQGDLDANAVAVEEALECAFHGMGTGPERQQAQRLASAKAFEVLNAGNVENRNAVAVLKGVIRRTASMPGQRAIVLVSPGFLAIAPDMRQDVMEIVDRAVHSGIIVNTLDARGLYTVGISGNSSHPGQDRLQYDSAEAQARSDVMFEFADGTGGIFFHNNNDLDEGFRRTAAAPEFVYVLGFSPQRLDGKFHKLKVALNGAGKLEVQARRGYYALKPVGVN